MCFYDVNLRPGFDSQGLVTELIQRAGVVEPNKPEAAEIAGFLTLPRTHQEFWIHGAPEWSSAQIAALSEKEK